MGRMMSHRIPKLLCTAVISIALYNAPAFAKAADAEDLRISSCIRQASLGHPWLEKTLWGLRDQEAGWIGAEVRNSNGSHDLGPLQINSWWIPRIAALVGHSPGQVRFWLRFDPCFNAEAARWIFLSALRSTDNYWKAIGIYHSPTAWRQTRYVNSVARHMRSRYGENIFLP